MSNFYSWILTPGEIQGAIKEADGEFPPIRTVEEEARHKEGIIAFTQDRKTKRKLIEWIEQIWNDPIMTVYFRLEDWQALRKEVGLE